MKTHLYHCIIITLLFSCLASIQNPIYGQNKDHAIETSLKALKSIKEEDYTSFKNMFAEGAMAKVTDEKFKSISVLLKDILDRYNVVLENDIKIDTIILEGKELEQFIALSQINTTKPKVAINNLVIPIIVKTNIDSIKYIKSSVLEKNKLLNFTIFDRNPLEKVSRRIIEPQKTTPHLSSLYFDIKDLKWFRIWYNNGYRKDRQVKNKNYFAVSGGSYMPNTAQLDSIKNTILNNKNLSLEEREKAKNEFDAFYAIMKAGLNNLSNEESIKDLEIRKLLQKLFHEINKSNIEIKDYKYLRDKDNGNPEYLYLRFLFEGDQYREIGELQVRLILNEEPNTKEPLSTYIEIKHSDKTRYLLLKKKNKELTNILKKIAIYDYKNYYEENP